MKEAEEEEEEEERRQVGLTYRTVYIICRYTGNLLRELWVRFGEFVRKAASPSRYHAHIHPSIYL